METDFLTWLMSYRQPGSVFNDIACDVWQDHLSGCLKSQTPDGIRRHILWHEACTRALEDLEDAIDLYRLMQGVDL